MKLNFSFILFLVATLCVACGNRDGVDEPAKPEVYTYIGSTYVQYKGEEYCKDSVQVILDVHTQDNALVSTLSLRHVKFVPQMPLTLDIDVPGIPTVLEQGTYYMQADSIVPTMGGNPVERYMARNLVATANSDSISLQLTFADYPTRYEGKVVRQ